MLSNETWSAGPGISGRVLKQWAVIAVMTCVVATAGADDALSLSGAYVHAPEQSSDVAKAIDQAVEKMNFIKRPIARSRLTRTNAPYQRVRIQLGAAEAEITYDDRKPIRMPLDGQSIKWTRDDGEVFDVSAKVEGGKLLQTYKAEDGARVNAFTKDASGALRLEVEVSSPQLSQPVKYVLVYRSGT